MKEYVDRIKNNKLDVFTRISAIVFAVFYFIGLIILVINKYSLSSILSLSADYVTIVSFVLVLIQLIAFVKDSRRNEFRSRKEAAYKITREYADNVLGRMCFIQNVLSLNYNKNDGYELQNTICSAELDGFTVKDMQCNTAYQKYIEIYINDPENSISDYDIVLNLSITNRISGFLDIAGLHDKQDIMKYLINTRFHSYIIDTLNVLECFSMSVNQNVSDSEMLYDTLHQTFLKFVRYVYPYICRQNNEAEIFYRNIIKLFFTWNKKAVDERKLREELERQKQEKLKQKSSWAKPL